MVTAERMDIFIDEHILVARENVRRIVRKLINDNNVGFLEEVDKLLSVEDVLSSAGEMLLILINKYNRW